VPARVAGVAASGAFSIAFSRDRRITVSTRERRTCQRIGFHEIYARMSIVQRPFFAFMVRMGCATAIVTSLTLAGNAQATDITVSGLFPGKALVQINRGALQTLSVGQKTPEGITLVSVDPDSATFDIDGKRVTMGMGTARMGASAPAVESVVLTADVQGHFPADGQVNGRAIRFVVDTGATLVSLPVAEARRLAIDYHMGQKALMGTANGTTVGYVVKLDTVSIGGVTLHGVDAVVMEGNGLGAPLLGMSFLNRMNMKREGDLMTLTRRY
jgi:aspartyl protease family protein